MLAVLEVWQAILVKKLDLDSSWVKQSMSEGARQLLKVSKAPPRANSTAAVLPEAVSEGSNIGLVLTLLSGFICAPSLRLSDSYAGQALPSLRQ